MYHEPSQLLHSPSITTHLSFIVYVFCLLSSTFQPSSHNWPSDNREEIFNPGKILEIVSDGFNILGSVKEPLLLVCGVPRLA